MKVVHTHSGCSSLVFNLMPHKKPLYFIYKKYIQIKTLGLARTARVEIALYVYYNIVKSCYFNKTFPRDLQLLQCFSPIMKKCKLCLSLLPCVFRGFKIKFCHGSFKLFCYYGNLLRHKDVYIFFSNEWLLLINAISVIASLN